MEQLSVELTPDLYYFVRAIAHQEGESISVVICQLLYSSLEYQQLQAQVERLANQLNNTTPTIDLIKLNGHVKPS